MNHSEKIQWMTEWCKENDCTLTLEGECGFGRPCVGILKCGVYPDYNWYNDDFDRVDENGPVWVPPDAYHKHDCVAVLGRGQDAEEQLFDWLKWFDSNGFVIESGPHPRNANEDFLFSLMGCGWARMVKKQALLLH